MADKLEQYREGIDILKELGLLPAKEDSQKEQNNIRKEKIKSLKIIIEEQRRDNNYLLHIYNRTRATESILLTAVFGLIVYLYSNATATTKASIATRLSVPPQEYGKVIYVIAAAFFIYGVIRLVLIVFGHNPWQTTYETPKDNYSYDELETLEYYKERHDTCHDFNLQQYQKRKRDLIILFYCILISAIILIVIKTLT